MEKLGDHHLQVVFDDISHPHGGYILPLEEHLHEVLNFTQDLNDEDRVLVHCHQGISRSTAMAIAILIQHDWNYDAAFLHIQQIRPILKPNRLITKYVDDHFNLGGNLIELVHQHSIRRFYGLWDANGNPIL